MRVIHGTFLTKETSMKQPHFANKFSVSKEFRFEAAHSLPHLPDGHKCRRPHGHSYRFKIEVIGYTDERGFVIDYAELSEIAAPIIERLDHRDLNEIFDFPTTAENIAAWLWKEVSAKMPRGTSHKIRFYETATTEVAFPL